MLINSRAQIPRLGKKKSGAVNKVENTKDSSEVCWWTSFQENLSKCVFLHWSVSQQLESAFDLYKFKQTTIYRPQELW